MVWAELTALSAQDYEDAEWRLARAGADYHVEYEHFFYSAPYGLIREQVDVRAARSASRAAPAPLGSVTPPAWRMWTGGLTAREKPRTITMIQEHAPALAGFPRKRSPA